MEEQGLEHSSSSCEADLFTTALHHGDKWSRDKLETVISPFHGISIFMEKQSLKQSLERILSSCSLTILVSILSVLYY